MFSGGASGILWAPSWPGPSCCNGRLSSSSWLFPLFLHHKKSPARTTSSTITPAVGATISTMCAAQIKEEPEDVIFQLINISWTWTSLEEKEFLRSNWAPFHQLNDIIDVVRILWEQQSIIWWYWVSGPSHLFILYFLSSTFPLNHHSCDKESTVWLSVNLQCSSAARLREVPETQAFSQPHKWSSSNF